MASTQQQQQEEPALTHEEIWDDSALVNTWDEALAEYKKYHSIMAKGADADALIKAAEEAEMKDVPPLQPNPDSIALDEAKLETEGLEQGAIDSRAEPAALAQSIDSQLQDILTDDKAVESEATPKADRPQSTQPPLPQVSQGFVVGGNNEALRNIMMSWYWAGYYTGLYEGQQQAQQQNGQPPNPTR